MTTKEKELIRCFCGKNLTTHTDWTGVRIETKYKCENLDEFIENLIAYVEKSNEEY